jgi:alpha-amylase
MGREGTGIGGGEYDADNGSFPDVPYTMDNFNGCENCPDCCCINDWNSHQMVRDCRLLGLIDLNPQIPDTLDKIVGYLNDVIDIGVAGFRVDAAKHMWPEDLELIQNNLHDLNTQWFPSGAKAFFGMEVLYIQTLSWCL